MNEEHLIRALQRIHGFRPYEADADVAPDGSGTLLVSSDSFSAAEDFLAGLAPGDMGRLMAYGACTDLLACGARPEAMSQVWTCSSSEPLKFYEQVAEGVQEVLAHALEKRPHQEFGLRPHAERLLDHPLSDVTHAVDEAAMCAARARRKRVEEADLSLAIDDLLQHQEARNNHRKPIGFAE